MADLFLKQKEKGGIIDLEEEGRKYLVLTGSMESGEMGQLSPTDFSGWLIPPKKCSDSVQKRIGRKST